MLAYQIEQLKEDISGKESGLKSCEGLLAKCHKRTEQLRMEIQAGLAKLSEARADIAALRQEEARLNRIVQVGYLTKATLSYNRLNTPFGFQISIATPPIPICFEN